MVERAGQKVEKEGSRKSFTGYNQHQQLKVLPDNWDFRQLKDISTQVVQKAKDQKLETLSISAGIGFINQAEKFGKELSGKQYVNYTVVRKGDFVYNKGNSKSYPQGCIYRLEDREISAVPNVFISFRLKKKSLESDYYKHLFISGYLNPQLVKLINAGVRNDGLLNLYNEDFFSCSVPVPPLLEQQKIAEILNLCDKIIDLKQQLIEQEKERKKWLIQSLLNPDSGVRLVRFSEEWQTKALGKISMLRGGGTPSTHNAGYWKGDVPWLSSADVIEGDIHSINPSRFITVAAIENSSTQICPQGSILVVTRVGVGKLAIAPFPVCTSQDFSNIVSVDGNNEFIAFSLLKELKKLKSQVQGTSIKGITIQELKKLRIEMPGEEEQRAISHFLNAQGQLISQLESDLTLWRNKRQALSRILLSGIVQVSTHGG